MPSLASRLRSFPRFWNTEVLQGWLRRSIRTPGWRGFLLRQLSIFILTFKSLNQDITLRSAALTYRTLLALVPTLAVIFALFNAFGGLQALREPLSDAILGNLAVVQQEQVEGWLNRFIENIHSGAIAGVGLAGMAYTAVGLMNDVEFSINRVWEIRKDRPFFQRIMRHWALLTLAPPLVGYSISLSSSLKNSSVAERLEGALPWGMGSWLLSLSTVVAVCFAFALVYKLIPNTRVKLGAALIGGVVAGGLWSLVKTLFIAIFATSVRYNAIYGALGVLPLLMLWLYISWMIVLFGSRYAFANQAPTFFGGAPPLNQTGRERLALALVVALVARLRAGCSPVTSDELAERVSTSPPVAEEILGALEEAGLVGLIDDDGDRSYFLQRDPSTTNACEVFVGIRGSAEAPFQPQREEVQIAADLTVRADEAARTVLSEQTLSQLAAVHEGAPYTDARCVPSSHERSEDDQGDRHEGTGGGREADEGQ